MRALLLVGLVLGLAACASAPNKSASRAAPLPGKGQVVAAPLPAGKKKSPYAAAQEDPGKRGHYTAGGLYAPHIADSTPDEIPDVDAIPEPEVTNEPRSRVGNRASYTVLGKQYQLLDHPAGYVEQGTASYYGNKFHGRRTSNLEVYDMYAFTAAHKTLPLPSFARVSNLDNGKSVVVRVNDRGPFHEGRVIDLSYAAAVKLGITQRGTGRVEVRALTAGDAAAPSYASAGNNPPPQVATSKSKPAASTLDRLVAAMPIASAAAAELPPGVRIATGKPTSLKPTSLKPAAAMPAIDASNTHAGNTHTGDPKPPTAVTAKPANDYRFDMRQDGKAMTAAEFDAWMAMRQVRVATGAPGVPDKHPAAAIAVTDATASAPAPKQAAAVVARQVANVSSGDGVTLQVASFAARGNADRALTLLRGAGIGDARLLDASANGQKVWRLRVGPLAANAAPELAARIVGLGFGQPQRVRD